MKKLTFLFRSSLLLCISISIFLISCETNDDQIEVLEIEGIVGYDIEPIEGQYIVVLKGASAAKKEKLKYNQMKSTSLNEISRTSNAIAI